MSGLIVLLVGACAVVFVPIAQTEMKLQEELGPRATSVSLTWYNGRTTFTIQLAPGYDRQATDIACGIVKPIIARSSTPDAHFEIWGSDRTRSYWLADETTPCG